MIDGMLVLAALFLIVGVALLLVPVPLANKDAVGWVAVVIGVILLLVVLLLGSGGIDFDAGERAVAAAR